jgi:hypothetical protein
MKLIWVGMIAGLAACSPTGGGQDAGTGGGSGGSCAGEAKTPPNLVPNSGFECGDLGWSPQSGTLAADSDPHTGRQSAKLVATGATPAGKFAATLPVVASASGKTYCATAYLKGSLADAQLSVLEDKGGTVIDHTFSMPVMGSTTWLRTPPSINLDVAAAAGSKLYVRVLMRNPKASDTLFVDDVDLWESSDGKCKETR